jgi:hypothetical protein
VEIPVERSTEVLIGAAAVTLAAAIAVYRWRQRKRRCQVETSVRAYLSTRYGELPEDLHIGCSDDSLWPVLVAFCEPRTGTRKRLRFDYRGPDSPLVLLSEAEDKP